MQTKAALFTLEAELWGFLLCIRALEHASDALSQLEEGVQNLAIAELSEALRHARASAQQSELLLWLVRAAVWQLAVFGDKLQIGQASLVYCRLSR